MILYSIENYQGYGALSAESEGLNEQRIHDVIRQMKMRYPDGDEIIVTGEEGGFREKPTIGGHYKKEKPGSFLFVDHGWSRKAPPRYQKETDLISK